MIESILAVFVLVLGAFHFGGVASRKKQEQKQKEKELEIQRKVIDVRPATDANAALERLRKNGYVNSLPTKATERQLELPL